MADENETAQNLEDLAEAIEKLGKAHKALQSSRLTSRAILLLLRDITKLPARDINAVLQALPELERRFLKKNGNKKR